MSEEAFDEAPISRARCTVERDPALERKQNHIAKDESDNARPQSCLKAKHVSEQYQSTNSSMA
jgi:hypothetical protein